MHLASRGLRFQFGLSTILCGISAVAALCAVTRWLGAIPYRGLLPAAALVMACVVARRQKSTELPWALLAMAVCWTVADSTRQMFHCLTSMSHPTAAIVHQDLVEAYWAVTALPLLLAVPSVLLICMASSQTRSAGRKWLILCTLFATLNGAMLPWYLIWVVDHIQFPTGQ